METQQELEKLVTRLIEDKVISAEEATFLLKLSAEKNQFSSLYPSDGVPPNGTIECGKPFWGGIVIDPKSNSTIPNSGKHETITSYNLNGRQY